MKDRLLLLTTSLFLCSLTLLAQSSSTPVEPVHVLVLGVYHMDNPGKDIANVTSDDVLQPNRQQEIAQVLEVLKKYRPTKVAIEASADNGKARQQYADYLAGKYTLTRNEVDQLGYRLAKELGHKNIYPIDTQGKFRFEEVMSFAKANGQEALINESMQQAQTVVGTVNEKLKGGTVLDALQYLNSPELTREGNFLYMRMVRVCGKVSCPGADLLTDWYERNIRIFGNLLQNVAPGDRVLVIYGSGHQYWLERNVLDSPGMVLERLNDYVR